MGLRPGTLRLGRRWGRGEDTPALRGAGAGAALGVGGTCSCPPPRRAEAGVGPRRSFHSSFHHIPLGAPRDLDPGRIYLRLHQS